MKCFKVLILCAVLSFADSIYAIATSVGGSGGAMKRYEVIIKATAPAPKKD